MKNPLAGFCSQELCKFLDCNFLKCIEISGVVSEGDTINELKANLLEALEGVLESYIGHNTTHPLPDVKLNSDANLTMIRISPELAFRIALRDYRIQRHYTQDVMRQKLGLNNRNSYVKLETKGNPTFRTAGKVVEAFPDFPITECFC